jgi:hypothetical protein
MAFLLVRCAIARISLALQSSAAQLARRQEGTMKEALRAVGPSLWEATTEILLGRVYTPARCVIVRRPEGLWIHSPLPPEPALVEAVRGLGEVAHLVSPNRSHYLFVNRWQALFPGARVWRPDDLRAGAAFSGFLQQTILGAPKFDETLFLHEESRSLIVTDLFLNVHQHPLFWTRFAFRVLGTYGRAKQGLFWKLRTTDRAAARASLETVLGWDFDRILPAHGEIVQEAPKETLRRACAWMLRP